MSERLVALRTFTVTGVIDGAVVSARWDLGGLLTGDDVLLARAGLAIAVDDAMGDEVTTPVSSRWAFATIRACDEILDASVGVAR